jgi:hypothetical protein
MTKLKDWDWKISDADKQIIEEIRGWEERTMQAKCEANGNRLLLPKSRITHRSHQVKEST